MRGTVLQYDDNAGSGFISGDDGVRYTFRRSDLQQLRPIAAGAKVDFVPKEGTATEIGHRHADPVAASAQPQPVAGFGGGYAPAGAVAPPAGAYTGEDLGLWDYFKKVMAKSFNGEGRARRKEYWSFVLFYALIWIVVYVILMFTVLGSLSATYYDYSYGYGYGGNPFAFLGALGVWAFLIVILALVFLPATITVMIRRLHDIGMSGWMILIGFIPLLGGLFLFVCTLIPSQAQVNKHGPIPKPQPTVYTG